MEQQLANLPAPALITFGAVLAVIFAVRYLGLWQGRQASPASSSAAAQVAAVIVDPAALNRLTDQASALNEALSRLVEVGEDMSRSQSHMATELDRIREELRIQREISRNR